MPIATFVCPSRHARPNVSVITTATVAWARFASSSRRRAAVRTVDTGVRAHEAVPRLDDEDSALPPHDLLRLAKHHFELSGVLSRFLGHLERTLAGNDVPKSHDSALTLRNNLLR